MCAVFPVARGDLATASHEDLSAERRENGASRCMKCSAIAGVRTGCINPVLPGATILLNVLLGDCLVSWAMHGDSSFGSCGVYSSPHGDCLPPNPVPAVFQSPSGCLPLLDDAPPGTPALQAF